MNTVALRQIVTADASHTIHVKLPPKIFDRVEVVVMFAANDQSEIPEESLTWIATACGPRDDDNNAPCHCEERPLPCHCEERSDVAIQFSP